MFSALVSLSARIVVTKNLFHEAKAVKYFVLNTTLRFHTTYPTLSECFHSFFLGKNFHIKVNKKIFMVTIFT